MNDPLVRKSTRGNFHLIEQLKIQIQKRVDFIIFTAQNYVLESLISLLYISKPRTGHFLQKDKHQKSRIHVFMVNNRIFKFTLKLLLKARDISICEY